MATAFPASLLLFGGLGFLFLWALHGSGLRNFGTAGHRPRSGSASGSGAPRPGLVFKAPGAAPDAGGHGGNHERPASPGPKSERHREDSLAVRCIARLRAYLFHDEWAIGVLRRPVASLLANGDTSDAEWLPLPRNLKVLADPFLAMLGGRPHIVCEAMDRLSDRGHLVLAGLDELRAGRVRTLSVAPHHLSYPFLFPWEGRLYCIPEAHASGRVDLHELVVEGDVATLRHRITLLDEVRLCDPTIVHHEGRFWLFATEMEGDANRRLCLYFSDSLFGPFTAHPRNPVKVDAVGARPAGALFETEAGLFRPAQDSSATYGGRVVLHRVDRLTPSTFEESSVGVVAPRPGSPYPHGLHTINGAGEWTVIDGKCRRFVGRPSAFVARYGAGIRRRWGVVLQRLRGGNRGVLPTRGETIVTEARNAAGR